MFDHKQSKIYPIFKAAIVLMGSDTSGNEVILLAKSPFPRRWKKSLSESLSQCDLECFLTFPAGHFDPKQETSEQGALRELSEETGGCFFTDNIKTPWQNNKTNPALFSQCLKTSVKNLQVINKDPVELLIYNAWDNKINKISYFFFLLKAPALTAKKLTLFCQNAQAVFLENQMSVYREIIEYIPVSPEIFLEQIKAFSNYTASEDWFFADTSNTDRFTLFKQDDNATGYQCNKGYFYALSRKYDILTKFLNPN